jgi:hypothetical protein
MTTLKKLPKTKESKIPENIKKSYIGVFHVKKMKIK